MAIINQYKVTYPSTVNNFESDSFYINATSMEKAVEMSTLEHGLEPTICTRIHDNVLTEVTSATTVNFQIKSSMQYFSLFSFPYLVCKEARKELRFFFFFQVSVTNWGKSDGIATLFLACTKTIWQ